jgi:hypothetical protein
VPRGRRPPERYLRRVRMLIVLIAAAVLGTAVWLAFGRSDPVTKAEIERTVAKKPHGQVQLVLCNEQFVPSEDPERTPPKTWTCDTYLGRNKAEAQNGPSYRVIVADDHIRSIRQVPVH